VRLNPGPAKPEPVMVIDSAAGQRARGGCHRVDHRDAEGEPRAGPGDETAWTVAPPVAVNAAPTDATTLAVPPASLIMDGVVTVISVSDTTVAETRR